MENVNVSVIIPTYRRTEDITRALDSVLAQTLEAVEVIVVDDNGIGSECGIATETAMRPYIDSKRITYIQHEKNKNGSAARNTGIKVAKGKYISFLDDDDIYRPDRLEKMCSRMDALDDSWGACYTGYIKHQSSGQEQYSAEKVEGDVFVQALMRSFYIGTGSNLFFRRAVIDDIGLFDETFKRNQDLEYIVRVLKKYKIAYVDEFLVEKFHDIRTVNLSFAQSVERENAFRSKFVHYLEELPLKSQKEIKIMWDIDWIRTMFDKHMYGEMLKTMAKSKIPFKVWISYVKYIIERKKNNLSYGFVVKL